MARRRWWEGVSPVREPKVYTLMDLFEAAAEWRTAELRIEHSNYSSNSMYDKRNKAHKRLITITDALIESLPEKDLTSDLVKRIMEP